MKKKKKSGKHAVGSRTEKDKWESQFMDSTQNLANSQSSLWCCTISYIMMKLHSLFRVP